VRLSIIGLGYVGTVSGACLAEGGHDVTLVDVNPLKIEQLNAGRSPIAEIGVEELVAANVERGRLRATDDISSAVMHSDASIVCVGTPTGRAGDVHLDDVKTVMRQIAGVLGRKNAWHLVVVTSTVPPGTVDADLAPILTEAGQQPGADFGLAFAPEFLREGTAVADFQAPPKTVIGANDEASRRAALEIYGPYARKLANTTIREAEMVKFVDNSWHALKVAFANEIGRICAAVDLDSQAVMDIFKSDTRLNISPTYLTPGFAFGGSCLPKDLRTLTYRARTLGVEVPVLEAIMPSNAHHLALALRTLETLQPKSVALLGLAFKAGTDDLRESPMVELAERLLGKGYSVTIHDEHVNLNRLVGANREFVLTRLPHLAALLEEDLDLAMKGADVVVVGQKSPRYANITGMVEPHVRVLDLTGAARPTSPVTNSYVGLLW
jgi:GDP-mannose 6-dehydrogenase